MRVTIRTVTCHNCGRKLDPTDQIRTTGVGRYDTRGSVRCGPCAYRTVFPTLENPAWIIKSLSVAFLSLTTAQRRRLITYLESDTATLAVGRDFFSRYWVYNGIPRIEVAASGSVPKTRKVQVPNPTWDALSVEMERSTCAFDCKDSLSYHVARRDATLDQVRHALRRRPTRAKLLDPLEGLFD